MSHMELIASKTVKIDVKRQEDLVGDIRSEVKEASRDNWIAIVHQIFRLPTHLVEFDDSYLVVLHIYEKHSESELSTDFDNGLDKKCSERCPDENICERPSNIYDASKTKNGFLKALDFELQIFKNGQIQSGKDSLDHVEAIEKLIGLIANI